MQTTVNSIKDLFMGNPGALQQKIQTEQKAKPGIPPDLRELLALQEIQDQHQAMQRQQALQNPANQPTIADKLKQTLATQQQQMAQAGLPGAQGMPPQPERQPEMGVDQLPANLGQHYDGGGIVAFKNGGNESLETLETEGINKLKPLADKYKQEEAQFLAAAQSGDPQAIKLYMDAKESTRQDLESQVGKQFGNAAPRILGGLLAAAPAQTPNAVPVSETALAPSKPAGGIAESPLVKTSAPAAPAAPQKQVDGKTVDQVIAIARQRLEAEGAKFTPEDEQVLRRRFAGAYADPPKPVALPDALSKPPTAAAPKPPAPAAPKPTVEPAQPAETQDPLTAALEKQILGNLSINKNAEARARRTEAEKYLGLDSLLGAQRERAQKEYDMQKQQAQGRNAFSAFTAGINPNARTLAEGLRGGQQTLAAATAGWDKSDLESLQNFNKAMTGVDTQTVAGKKFAWDAENDFLKDLSAEARNSITSGTSLVNTRENAAARKQSAKDAADARVAAAKESRLGRESAAQIAKDTRADAATDRQDARYREQAMRLAVAAATKEKSLPQNITKLKNVSIEELAATRFNNFYEMLKSGKMPEAPGAESPGGTAPSGWGKAQLVK